MPELPEVETVRRGLEPAMAGARLIEVEARRPDLRFPLPADFAGRLAGRTVVSLGRRAKYLLADLSSGEVLVMHLGMTGRFLITRPDGGVEEPGDFAQEAGQARRHDHVVFRLSNGFVVTYNDARRFGFMDLVPRADLAASRHFKAMGIEPPIDRDTLAVLMFAGFRGLLLEFYERGPSPALDRAVELFEATLAVTFQPRA